MSTASHKLLHKTRPTHLIRVRLGQPQGKFNGFRYLICLIVLLTGLANAQVTTRHLYTGSSGNGQFNLVVNEDVPIGEEAFSISWYESSSMMQLRRTAYSTVTYDYTGIDAAGTLHLQRHLLWPDRHIDTTIDVQVTLTAPQTFKVSFEGPQAQLVFSAGENGLLSVSLFNDPPFDIPKNEGF